ncbi:MAG: toprim domain-containing protein, partial [Oscillospiraceae bacterium]
VIFGSDGIEGCEHSIFEILSNSIDEAREGYGNRIIVTKYKDSSIEIEDFGRGIPVDYNQSEEKYNWELVFCELYAGGKYDTNTEGSYEFSLGLNGLGLCATQYSSEYMDAEIVRDGYKYLVHFEKGENVGGMKKDETPKKQTGSRIKWRPDTDVFTDIDVSIDYFRDILKRQAVVNQGLTFILRAENEDGFSEEEFLYEEGLTDYVKEIVGENSMTTIQFWETEDKGKDREDKDEYKVKLSVAFCFSNKVKMLEYYHNSSFLEYGGSPEKAVKQAFVSELDGYLKKNNKYNKNESKITFQDIEDCLCLVSSSFSTQTSYENQTKKAITNKFIYDAMTRFLKHNIEVYFIENPDEALKICEQVIVNKRSRENAEKTRQTLKKKLSGNLDLSNRVQKLVDCRTKDTSVRELYIVEGDSALGACKLSRDASFQAIIPVRGKILNCLKADFDKIFKNDIICDIIKVLGCGVEVKTKSNKDFNYFDLDGLRWNKVVICTDADVDGFQIRTLILTMIYRLTPSLIENGFVYIAESPLYEITQGEKTYFAYNEVEKSEILEKISGKDIKIQRSKGLGENEPDMMWLTTMNPKTRRLIKVKPSGDSDTKKYFDILLGDDLAGRKQFIEDNGGYYLDLIDIS